jgi:hypothetical protein
LLIFGKSFYLRQAGFACSQQLLKAQDHNLKQRQNTCHTITNALPIGKSFIFANTHFMKRILTLFLVYYTCSTVAMAQGSGLPPVDRSPADISYYPNNYPVLKIQDKATEPLLARVIYGRPKKEGRPIFGSLVEYNKVWRLGANEATEIEFFKPVKIGGKKISKGRYTLYAVPGEVNWTIIVNKETDTWGSFKYDTKKDVVRVDVPVQKQTDIIESMAMAFDKTITGANLVIAWDNVKVALPITF